MNSIHCKIIGISREDKFYPFRKKYHIVGLTGVLYDPHENVKGYSAGTFDPDNGESDFYFYAVKIMPIVEVENATPVLDQK